MSKKINNRFNKDYTQYWQKAVNVSKDKISIPDELNVSYWLKKLNLYNFNNTLDLGCSYGRLFECLKKISKDVSGCDPEKYAIELAKKKKYYEVPKKLHFHQIALILFFLGVCLIQLILI